MFETTNELRHINQFWRGKNKLIIAKMKKFNIIRKLRHPEIKQSDCCAVSYSEILYQITVQFARLLGENVTYFILHKYFMCYLVCGTKDVFWWIGTLITSLDIQDTCTLLWRCGNVECVTSMSWPHRTFCRISCTRTSLSPKCFGFLSSDEKTCRDTFCLELSLAWSGEAENCKDTWIISPQTC